MGRVEVDEEPELRNFRGGSDWRDCQAGMSSSGTTSRQVTALALYSWGGRKATSWQRRGV